MDTSEVESKDAPGNTKEGSSWWVVLYAVNWVVLVVVVGCVVYLMVTPGGLTTGGQTKGGLTTGGQTTGGQTTDGQTTGGQNVGGQNGDVAMVANVTGVDDNLNQRAFTQDLVAFAVASNESFFTRFNEDWKRVPMERDVYNPRGYFNHSDNRFRAPVHGVYFFSVQGVTADDATAEPEVMIYTEKVGGAGVGVVWSRDVVTFGGSSLAMSVIVELVVNETVCVWGKGDLMGNTPPGTVFLGYLLRHLG